MACAIKVSEVKQEEHVMVVSYDADWNLISNGFTWTTVNVLTFSFALIHQQHHLNGWYTYINYNHGKHLH